MAQAAFENIVGTLFPESIPVSLERIDEFATGMVLVYTKRPRKLIPTRKHELDFTGCSLRSLLAEDQPEITVAHAKSYLFDTGKISSSTSLKAGTESSAQFLAKLTGKFTEEKEVNITGEFGKIFHKYTDVVNSCTAGNVKVNTNHSVVKRAIENGRSLFVITSIYEGERCNISIEAAAEEESAFEEGDEKVKKDIDDKHGKTLLLSREEPTPLSYLLMRIDVDSEGVLTTKLNTRLNTRLGGKPKGPKCKRKSDPKADPYEEWVVIDIETTKTSSNTTTTSTAAAAEAAASPPAVVSGEGKPEQEAVVKTVSDLGTAPPPPSGGQGSTSEISYPYPVPLASNPSAEITQEIFNQTPDSPPIPPQDVPDGGTGSRMPDRHYLYSLKDFQPFESETYGGILEESEDWVAPLLANKKLQDALLTYTKPPRTYERLNDLTEYFLEVGNAIRANKPEPENMLKDVAPILEALDKEKETRLQEITSVIVVAEAADEFPQHIIQQMIELPPDKRKLLQDLILSTPHGTSRHVYVGKGPYEDPVLKPIMNRMGFSVPRGTHNLVHTHFEDEDDEDILAAALILLLSSVQK